MSITRSIVVTLLVLCAAMNVHAACQASVSATPRPGAAQWQADNGMTSTLYDMSVTNTDSCVIQTVSLSITLSTGATISSAWNFDTTSGEVANFGDAIYPGSSFTGAGFILTGTSATVTVAIDEVHCSSTCGSQNNSTTAPTAPSNSTTPTAPSNSTTGPCDPAVEMYHQNTITAVSFSPFTGKFFPYVAQPGSSGYGYSNQDCLISLESLNSTSNNSTGSFQPYCTYVYIGNDQPFALAVSSAPVIPYTPTGVLTLYTYGLGTGANAAAVALKQCQCTLGNSTATCSIAGYASNY